MRKANKDKLARQLLIADSEPPLVWVTTLLPVQLEGGWKRADKLPDGCVYLHPRYGLASLRGLQDDAGRKWLHFSLAPACSLVLNDIGKMRGVFFPDDAIVSMAIPAAQSDMMHLWWSIDGAGLPMDPGWKAILSAHMSDDD